MTVLGILARGLVIKLIRVTATAVTVGLVSAAVGRWVVNPCGGETSEWLTFAVPLLAPPIVAWIFSFPHPSSLRYLDNGVPACLIAPLALAIAVDDYGEDCGVELIGGVVLIASYMQAVFGVGLGALLLWWWRRRQSPTATSE